MMEKLCAVCVLVVSLSSMFHGQIVPKSSPADSLKAKALALAENAVIELTSVESDENQIVLLTLAAETLWTSNEKRAQQLAGEAASKIRQVLNPVLENEEQVNSYVTYPGWVNRSRGDFVVMVAGHDPILAQELMASTRPLLLSLPAKTPSHKRQMENWIVDERELEQRIAFQAAGKNATLALKIGLASIAKGVSEDAINLLRRLQFKDPEAADRYAEAMVQRLIAEPFIRGDAADNLTTMLLRQFDDKDGVFTQVCKCPWKPLSVEPATVQRLADKWLAFAILQNDQNIGINFLNLMPTLLKLLPAQAKSINAKFDAIKKTEPKRIEDMSLREKVRDDDTAPEAVAALALKKPDGERFHIYRQAFYKAANRSKAALLKLSEHIENHPDGADKNWLVDEIAANLAGKTADVGDLDGARQLAGKVTSRNRRIGLLAFIAMEYEKKGEAAKAREVIDEINTIVDLRGTEKLPKVVIPSSILPSLVRAYALIDPLRALTLLEVTLPEFAPAMSRGFPPHLDRPIDLHLIIKQNRVFASLFPKAISKIAEADFDRTSRLSVFFSSREMSALAKLLIAQAVLTGRLGIEDPNDRREMLLLKN